MDVYVLICYAKDLIFEECSSDEIIGIFEHLSDAVEHVRRLGYEAAQDPWFDTEKIIWQSDFKDHYRDLSKMYYIEKHELR